MPLQDPASAPLRQKRMAFRLFRFAALAAVILASAAIALVLQGRADGRPMTLIAAALALGLFVLIGLAVATTVQLKKDDHDSRS